jgi:hypothetical protein
MTEDDTARADYAAAAADFIAGTQRIAALSLPSLPDDPAEAAAMRAAGYDVLAECVTLAWAWALISVAGEDDEAVQRVSAAELAAALGVAVADLPDAEFLAVLRETPGDGRVLSAFRPLPGAGRPSS